MIPLFFAFLAGVCAAVAINLFQYAASIIPCPFHPNEVKGDCTKCIFRPDPYKDRWS
jgi:hypothetical protein